MSSDVGVQYCLNASKLQQIKKQTQTQKDTMRKHKSQYFSQSEFMLLPNIFHPFPCCVSSFHNFTGAEEKNKEINKQVSTMSRFIIWLITNLSDTFSLFVTIALSNVPLFDLNLCKPSHFNTWENYFAIGRFQIAALQSPSVFSQRCKYEILRL